MKILGALIVALLFTITSAISTQIVEAHLVGQPPYFKVNGEYANLYPVPLTSLSDFPLPQDIAPKNYLLNQAINFELDINRLPAPPDVVKKTNFTWDFGDGIAAQGLKTSHTYSKIGSYLLTVHADDGTTPTPQLLESVLINILPDPNFPLPQAKINIEGKSSQDPLTDVLMFQLGKSLHFDASGSLPQGKIASYLWDFGDQQSSDKGVTDHFYPSDLTQVFPVLRVKDQNGFISDTFVEIQNQSAGVQVIPKASAKSAQVRKTPSQLPLTLGIIAAIVLGIFMVRLFVRGRGHGKHQ